jgi:hypothetical protein
MKARLVIAGKSKAEIAQAVTSAFDNKELPLPEPGAMCYMMSKQQYLNDGARNWHPHLMWFVPGDSAKSWGAQLPGSPVIAANDPEERMTIMIGLGRPLVRRDAGTYAVMHGFGPERYGSRLPLRFRRHRDLTAQRRLRRF